MVASPTRRSIVTFRLLAVVLAATLVTPRAGLAREQDRRLRLAAASAHLDVHHTPLSPAVLRRETFLPSSHVLPRDHASGAYVAAGVRSAGAVCPYTSLLSSYARFSCSSALSRTLVICPGSSWAVSTSTRTSRSSSWGPRQPTRTP